MQTRCCSVGQRRRGLDERLKRSAGRRAPRRASNGVAASGAATPTAGTTPPQIPRTPQASRQPPGVQRRENWQAPAAGMQPWRFNWAVSSALLQGSGSFQRTAARWAEALQAIRGSCLAAARCRQWIRRGRVGVRGRRRRRGRFHMPSSTQLEDGAASTLPCNHSYHIHAPRAAQLRSHVPAVIQIRPGSCLKQQARQHRRHRPTTARSTFPRLSDSPPNHGCDQGRRRCPRVHDAG